MVRSWSNSFICGGGQPHNLENGDVEYIHALLEANHAKDSHNSHDLDEQQEQLFSV